MPLKQQQLEEHKEPQDRKPQGIMEWWCKLYNLLKVADDEKFVLLSLLCDCVYLAVEQSWIDNGTGYYSDAVGKESFSPEIGVPLSLTLSILAAILDIAGHNVKA